MKNKIQDERVESESLKIYKICFFILCIGIFLDLIIKFNLYSFSETTKETVLAFLIESLLLIAVFYLNVFLLAKKGIAILVSSVNLEKFPKKKYAIASAIISGAIAIGLWTIRFCTGYWEYGVGFAILFCSLIYIITFTVPFVVLFVSFYLSFKIARKNQEK